MKTLTEIAKDAGMEVSVVTIDDLARHALVLGEKIVSATPEQIQILLLFKEKNGFDQTIRFMGVDFVENGI